MRSDWLASFVVFAEHMNFTHAARALHLSQPALHAQVGRLTQEVGVPLYLREGRALRLTETGEALVRFARQDGQRRALFLGRVKQSRRHLPLVLAAGEGAYLYVIGEGIQRFRSLHDAPLRLWTRSGRACLEALKAGHAHLGVTVRATDDEEMVSGVQETSAELLDHEARGDWVVTSLATFSPHLAVSASHPLAQRLDEAPWPLSVLAEEGLVVSPPGAPLRRQVTLACAAAGVSWRVAVEASGWPLLLHFVSLGLGVAVVNGCCRLPQGVVMAPLMGLPPTEYVLIHAVGACQGDPELAALKACLLMR